MNDEEFCDVDLGDEDDVLYGCAKAIKKASGDSGVEFKVILDESNVGKKAHSRQSSAKNFFYDSQLMNSLSLGSVHGKDVNQCSELSESDDDLEPFEKLARNMEDLTGDGGVVKKVVTPGVGGELTAGTTVRFHYSNYFEYGDEPMDSTYLRNKMAKSKIGQGDVLPGLVVALASMRLKETAQFIFKPVYAYGKLGCPPRIPANTSVLCEVRIESAVDAAAADEFEAAEWDWEKHNTASYDERLNAARAFHRKGNDYYGCKNLSKARRCYQRALWLMEHSPLADEKQETTSYTLQTKLFANLAKIYLDQSEPNKACTQCRLALELPYTMSYPLKAKIYFRYGSAKALLNAFEDARRYFLLTQKLRPNCPRIAKNLEDLSIAQRKYEAQEKFMIKRMFGLSNDSEKERKPNSAEEANTGRSTFSSGVTITELDSDGKKLVPYSNEGIVNTPGTGCEKNSDSENVLEQYPKNLKPEFIDIVLNELDRLTCSSKPPKEIVFPAHLSVEELAFLASTAADRSCQLQFIHKGPVKYPKVVRSPMVN